MILARVQKIIAASEEFGRHISNAKLIVNEFEMTSQQVSAAPLAAEDTLGAKEGDLVLCTQRCSPESGNTLDVVGIIDSIEMIGRSVYQKKSMCSWRNVSGTGHVDMKSVRTL